MDRRAFLESGISAALAGVALPAVARAAGDPLPPSMTAGVAANFTVNPRRMALITVDFQNCFVEGTPAAAPDGVRLLKRINAFAAKCRSKGVLVIHAAHILRPDLSNAGILAEYVQPIRDGMIAKGAQSAAFHRDLVVDKRDIIVEKPRFGAFHGTDLELILRTKGIDSVIVSGIATNVCCETTAREAAVRDFHMFFLSDGTATTGIGSLPPEYFQQATCATMQLFGQVLTLEEMTGKLTAA